MGFRALGFALLVGPVYAGDLPMTGAEFDAFSTGKSFSFARDGQVFGVETYRAGRRVMWMGADGTCLVGSWFAENGAICFVYEIDASGTPRVCAPIFAQGAGLRAQEAGGAVVIGQPTDTPDLSECSGPKIGA